jgi:hypothetical protein
MTHALKCWPEYFAAIAIGRKQFELRKDDRPFELGDTVLLQEYLPESEKYTGKELKFEISYVLRNAPKMGLKPGYCILGIISKPTE